MGYVASKVDQSNWYLVDANGAAMGNLGATAVVSITADFASLSAAEAGYAALTGNANITAAGANQDVCLVCYCEQATYVVDAIQCVFSGPTCDDTHEFFIYAITNLATEGNYVHANVNNGTWDETKYRMEATANTSRIQLADTNIMSLHVNHLQINHNWAGGRPVEMFAPTNSNLFVEQCILSVKDRLGPGSSSMIYGGANAGQKVVMKHNICYVLDYSSSSGSYFYGFSTIHNGVFLIINNTFWSLDDFNAGNGLCLINNFIDARNFVPVAADYHDFNLYRQSDLDEAHGKLTTGTAVELFTKASGDEDTWDWKPLGQGK
ncbi:MAG: hypothetical protein GY845_09430 [Planctomycetes bacterium]|nr:hypothetical protein [Planctomycetota bacterium]